MASKTALARLPTQNSNSFLVFCLLLFTIVVVSAAFHKDRFYLPLKPVIIIVASIGFWKLIFAWCQNYFTSNVPNLLIAVAIAVGIFSCIDISQQKLEENHQSVAKEASHRRAHTRISEMIPRHAIILSDVSFRVALNADRPSIRLPRNPDQLWEISNRFGEIDYILIGERVLRGAGGYKAYQGFVTSEAFLSRFKLSEILPNNEEIYIRKTISESLMNDEQSP